VADIASAAQRIVVMNRGSVLFNGTPVEMIDAVRGRAWQVMTDDAGLGSLQQRYAVTEVQREASGVLARFVTEDPDVPGAELRDATLEDAYVWLMSGGHAVGLTPGRSERSVVK
jgi:hypothetical protein